jgi:ABC-2 type transport system permease protein
MRAAVQAFAAAVRLQLAELRRAPAQFLVLLTTPLLTAVFLSVALQSRSPAALRASLVAPGVMALWLVGVDIAGSAVGNERVQGTLQLMIATPASPVAVVLGRVTTVLVVGLAAFVESGLVAFAGFGVRVDVHAPGLLVAAAAACFVSTAATATLLSCLFVLSRRVVHVQNLLTYPVYILGGVLVPLSLMPAWVAVTGRAVYLSWSSDLMRATLTAGPVPDALWKLLAVLGLGGATFAVAVVAMRRVVDKVRRSGALELA